jgi:hypothetical protein
MKRLTTIGVIAAGALALSAALAGPALASKKLLTFYANGAVIPLGSPFETGFELETTDPVKISIPAAGLSLVCAADPKFAIFGWFASNGLGTDTVGTNGYETGPSRECSGHELGGLLFDGTLHLQSKGHVLDGENEYLEYLPQLKVDDCYFFGKLKGKESLPGPLQVTLKGAMKSKSATCPPVANVELGPLDGYFNSQPIEGRLSP